MPQALFVCPEKSAGESREKGVGESGKRRERAGEKSKEKSKGESKGESKEERARAHPAEAKPGAALA